MVQNSRHDHVGKAVSWLLFGVAGGLGLDLCAKELLQDYSLQEFILIRSVIALAVFIVLAPSVFGGLQSLRSTRWRWHVLRTFLAVGAMYGFFYGLAVMPLVNVLTLAYSAPLMMTALSVPFLGEHVGWRRWMAVVVGFIGVVVMLRPGSGEFNLASVGVLIAAFCYAAQAITARHLRQTESTLSMAVYVVVGPMLISATLLDSGSWLAPDAYGWLLMAGAGGCSVIAWVGLINGYKGAAPALLAPLEYVGLIGGAIAGYLFWNEVPNGAVILGGTIIIASGLFVVYREADHTGGGS